jgi:hypothetical protein
VVIDIQPANIMVQLPDEFLINDYLKSTHVETQPHDSDAEYHVQSHTACVISTSRKDST